MAYSKQTWNDNASGGTPITAARLNHIEDGINGAHTAAAAASTAAANAAKTATNHNDYIVSQGTSGIWYYQKYNSGRAVCYGRVDNTGSFNINTAWGSGWYLSSELAARAYPFTFAAKPNEVCTIMLVNPQNTNTVYTGVQSCHAQNSTSKTGSYEVLRSGGGTNYGAQITYVVEGRWK